MLRHLTLTKETDSELTIKQVFDRCQLRKIVFTRSSGERQIWVRQPDGSVKQEIK